MAAAVTSALTSVAAAADVPTASEAVEETILHPDISGGAPPSSPTSAAGVNQRNISVNVTLTMRPPRESADPSRQQQQQPAAVLVTGADDISESADSEAVVGADRFACYQSAQSVAATITIQPKPFEDGLALMTQSDV